MCWVQTGFSLELMAAKEDWLEDSPSMDVTWAVLRNLFSAQFWFCAPALSSIPTSPPFHRGELSVPEFAISCGAVVRVLPVYLISLQNSPLTRCPENPVGRSTF